MPGCVFLCLWLYNLTGDYMSSTELMSKSTGSAGSLTAERTERGTRSTREGEMKGQRQHVCRRGRKSTDAVRATSHFSRCLLEILVNSMCECKPRSVAEQLILPVLWRAQLFIYLLFC